MEDTIWGMIFFFFFRFSYRGVFGGFVRMAEPMTAVDNIIIDAMLLLICAQCTHVQVFLMYFMIASLLEGDTTKTRVFTETFFAVVT